MGSAGSGGFVLDSSGNPLSTLTQLIIDEFNTNTDNSFTSGSKAFDDPNTWSWTNSSVTGNGDINNVLYHMGMDQSVPSDPRQWLILGADRRSTNGTSYIDFEFFQAHPALSADESKLYFASDRPGGLGGSDLWYAVILGDSISSEPVNLGSKINTAGRDTFPFVDGNNVLYFASDSYAGMGGLDIYSLNLSDESAGITHLSEPVNSPMDDFGLVYSVQKEEGYFASNRGGTDSQGDEIYSFKTVCKIALSGNVYDEETGEKIQGAFVQVFDGTNNSVHEFVVGQDGLFSFEHKCDQDLRIVATAPGYEPNEVILHTPSVSSEMNVPIPLKFKDLCAPNDLGCKLNLEPIYFDFDRYNIRPDAAVELAKILVAMQEYPELVINIESHTDQRGSEEYNEILSSKRAASTRSWLIENGIAAVRLTAKGFGESQPLINCDEGDCSDDDHQINRRSVFLVQK